MVKISKSNKLTKKRNDLKKEENHKKIGTNKLAIILFPILSLILNIVFIPGTSGLFEAEFSPSLFYLIALFVAFIILIGIYKSDNLKYRDGIAYFFFFLLVISIIVSIFSNTEYEGINQKIYRKFELILQYLAVLLSEIGLLIIFLFRQKLENYINHLFSNRSNKDADDVEKVDYQYNTNSRLGSRYIKLVLLSIVLVIALFTNFYKLDGFDLYSDEAQVTQGAAGYYYTGEFKQWSFIKEKTVGKPYLRAWTHLFLIAQSYKAFGITPWASRFPSAFFGIILILSAFFIIRYFVNDNIVAFLSCFAFAVNSHFLELFRWARMYAIVIPLFLLAFYSGYRFLTEPNKLKFLNFLNNSRFGAYLNFNYKYLLGFVILLYFLFNLHVNSLLVLLILLIVSVFYYFLFKEKKYLFVFVGGVLLAISGYFILPNVAGVSNYLTPFEQKNALSYLIFLLGYPFSLYISIAFLVMGIGLLLIIKNDKFRKVYLLFYISVALTWLLFGYIFNYPVSFRYMSFMASISILLVLSVFIIFLKAVFNKGFQWVGYTLLIIIICTNFYFSYGRLYVKNPLYPSYPSIAIKTIVEKHKKGDLIYRHWGPDFYYKGIDKSVKVKELGGYKGKSFELVLDTLKKYHSGWLTWMGHNGFRMDPELVDYCNIYFKKYHGMGIDKTGVELFYFTDSMLRDTNIFNFEKKLPFANLKMDNPYSIAFWIKPNDKNTQPPFLISNISGNGIKINQTNSQNVSLSFVYQNQSLDSLIIDNLLPDKMYHICLFQASGKKGDEYGVFVNGLKIGTGKLKSDLTGYVKFKLNPAFLGERRDIRIYNFVLNELQVKEIMNNIDNPISAELRVNNQPFKTLFHWRKN